MIALEGELLRLCDVHKEEFSRAAPPVAPEPEPVDVRQLRKELQQQALEGVSLLKFSERRDAKREVAARLDTAELARILDQMEPDEAADLLGDIPPEQAA